MSIAEIFCVINIVFRMQIPTNMQSFSTRFNEGVKDLTSLSDIIMLSYSSKASKEAEKEFFDRV